MTTMTNKTLIRIYLNMILNTITKKNMVLLGHIAYIYKFWQTDLSGLNINK